MQFNTTDLGFLIRIAGNTQNTGSLTPQPITPGQRPNVNSSEKATKTTRNLQELRETAIAAGKIAATELLSWQGKFNIRAKAPSDLVTEADEAAQRLIRDHLLTAFPSHDFLGEESAEDAPKRLSDVDNLWVVDPLDGTTNYVHGFPYFCVSIALVCKGDLTIGVVLNPNNHECFSASVGCGAFLNEQTIHVSKTSRMCEALLAASFPAEVDRNSVEVTRFLKMLDASRSIRRLGAAALNLANLAAGRIDGYWGSTAKAWDVAAGLLLIREAGGITTNIRGGEFDIDRPNFLTASTPELHNELKPMLE